MAVGAGIPPPCLRSIISKQVESSELGNSFYRFFSKKAFFLSRFFVWENFKVYNQFIYILYGKIMQKKFTSYAL